MAFKSSDSKNSEGRNRGGKDQKKKMKKMRSIKLPKLSSLNSSSSRRATWQFDLSAIDLAIDELNSMESSDSKKENFEVESESEDTSASPSSNPKSKSDQTPDNSSPHDPKNSNTSGGKIAMKNFTRTPSMRTVRILKSKASFKSKRPLIKKQSKDSNVERATCSSTLKDSKFSKEIEHFEGEDEAERLSAMKICPYHHCSLHGHCHGSEPVEKKPFLRRKKPPMKTPKSRRRENEERDGGEVLFGGNSKSEKIFVEDDFAAEKEHMDLSFTGKGQENGVGDMGRILFGGKQQFGKIFQQNEGGNAGEILVGGKSLSEKSFLENKGGDAVEILFDGKSQPEKSSQENEGGDAGEIFCVGKSQPEKRFEENEDGDAGEILLDGKLQPEKSLQENKGGDAGKILFGRKSKSGKIFQEILNQTNNLPDPQLRKENNISMWHLIHRQMVSGLKEDNFEENQAGDSNNFLLSKESLSRNISDADTSTEESEVRKNFAVKLVREAIEKILLPEVQDHSPDDQSISEQENSEESISISTESSKQEKARENDDNGEEKKGESSEKRVPKSWSYLKKVILLKRFVKELQKVREFTPRKVQSRPLDLDQEEGEKVSLRPQTTSGKRNSEEWMLDYAIRKVVSELAPNQKRKVSLLVKAFETVAPSQEDQPIYKVNATKIKGNYHQDFESNEVGNVVLTSNFDSSEKITEVHEGKNREFSVKDENGVLSSSLKCNVFEENNAKIEEKGDSTLTKDSDDITEENGAISSSPNFQVPEEIKAQMEDKKIDRKEESDPIKDSEDNRSENRAFKLRVKRENRVSMWHLIHEQMVSGLAAESGTDSLSGADEEQRADDARTTLANNGIESEEIKMRKSFAIKLVREAIEKILLPEVQDQSFDDQSITSDVTSDQDPNEKNRDEDFERHKANNMEDERSNEAKDESRKENSEEMKTERMEGSKSEKQKPKSWSYLKKVILLKRFVKELEKVKKFNPRKPNFLPLQPDQEDEKVSLRPQTVGEKRNTDEWMLDYAIRQVVSQLAPTQKRKVALLVQAFETVAPPNEDHPEIDSQSSGKFAGLDDKSDIKSNVSENMVSSSSFDLDEEVIVEQEREVKSRGFEPKIKMPVEKQDNIKMWHMVYQHVVSGIAEKVVGDDESDEKSQHRLEFSKSDAVKLVQEAVDEILDDSSETQSTSGDSITTQDDCQSPASDVITSQEEGKDRVIVRNEKQKSKNWSKLKKLILLKRSIKALGNVRKREDPKPPKILAVDGDDVANEKVDLRNQMVDERKKAEQWMLDYAVQHIVTKLTPDRKRRVAMLVEAFEAVVPLPLT